MYKQVINVHSMDPEDLIEKIQKGEIIAIDARYLETLYATLDTVIAQIAWPNIDPEMPAPIKFGYDMAREDLDKLLLLYFYFNKIPKIDENIH